MYYDPEINFGMIFGVSVLHFSLRNLSVLHFSLSVLHVRLSVLHVRLSVLHVRLSVLHLSVLLYM